MRLLLLSLFYHLRGFAVLTFVYVASIEQLMLFETVLSYVINSVVVLVLAELDELLFRVFSRTLLRDGLQTTVNLTPAETRASDVFTNYWLLPTVSLSMLGPLMVGKLTGIHCSERSRFRVSEISLFLLLISRVLCNVLFDVSSSSTRKPVSWQFYITAFFEHAVPCASYVFILYFVLVKLLKPPSDDDLFS